MRKFLVFLAASSFAASVLASSHAPVNNAENKDSTAQVVEVESKSSVVVTSATAKLKGNEIEVKFFASIKGGKELAIKEAAFEGAIAKITNPKDKAVITNTPKEFTVSLSEFKKALPKENEEVVLKLQLDSESVDVKAVLTK